MQKIKKIPPGIFLVDELRPKPKRGRPPNYPRYVLTELPASANERLIYAPPSINRWIHGIRLLFAIQNKMPPLPAKFIVTWDDVGSPSGVWATN